MICFQRGRERLERPLEYAQRIRDSHSVVCDRNTRFAASQHAGKHFPTVPHARAAVDYEIVRAEISREIVALHMRELELTADILP